MMFDKNKLDKITYYSKTIPKYNLKHTIQIYMHKTNKRHNK